jgi:hypothetical protein
VQAVFDSGRFPAARGDYRGARGEGTAQVPDVNQ